jgi:hypothetical protein
MDNREVLDHLQCLKEQGVPVDYEAMNIATYGDIEKYATAGSSAQEIANMLVRRSESAHGAPPTRP